MSCKSYKNQNGLAALLVVTVIMFTSVTLALSVVFVFLNQIKATRNIAYSYESIYAAESGVEDILLRYFDAEKSLPPYPSILSVGQASASTTLSEDIWGNAIIISGGERLDRDRRLAVSASLTGPGSFPLAVQIGAGGLFMESNSTIKGNVYSNGDITGESNSEIDGDASASGAISSPDPTVTGVKTEGVEMEDLPGVDIDYWKAQANINSDPLVGDQEYSGSGNTLGPKKIEGSLELNSNAELTLTGPVHVTGNFDMDSNSELFIDESLSATTTVIIVGGVINFSSNSRVHATTATPKGYIMLLSESTSSEAIDINSSNLIEGAVYAPNGTVFISSNADLISIAGHEIHLGSNAKIEYDFGLRVADFTGGPSAGAQIKSWQEQ